MIKWSFIKEYVILDHYTMIKGVVDVIENKLIMGYFNNNIKYSILIDKNNIKFNLFNPESFKNNKE